MKIKYKAFLLITLLYVPKASSAADRTTAQKRKAAVEVLCHNNSPKFRRLMGKAEEVKELDANAFMTVMGIEGGGFALIANDDAFEAVIGYSDSPYSKTKAEDNKNYQWWVKAIGCVLTSKQQKAAKSPLRTVAPGEGVEKAVAPLLTTTWAQDAPYNNYCPTEGDKHTLVGCVATAMSQVIFYNRHPAHGDGQRTIYYPYNDTNGTPYTVDFSKAEYKYDLMLNDYGNNYTEEQADAVATLCYHCGVASDMQYGTTASGTYLNTCRDGLVKYFGYSNATLYDRLKYSEEEWMNLIFKELSDGLPIIYGGADLVNFGSGHCFVFDGYDASGNVHVNWGWEGSFDGYYNVAYLNPSGYAFTDNQTMILGVDGRDNKEVKKAFNVAEAGNLAAQVSDEEKYSITSLEISGQINSTDLKLIREMAGRNADDSRTRGKLKNLNLRHATIKSGGDPFFGTTTTKDDEIPAKAFYNCYSLSYVALPEGTKAIGEAAFANTIGLDSVYVPTTGERDYVYDQGVVYSKDTTRVLTTMPFVSDKLTLQPSTKEIADNGIAGCTGLRSIEMPASLTAIGGSALSGNSFLTQIKVRAKKAPAVGSFAFDGISKTECRVYVPAGYKDGYEKADGWWQFAGSNYDNIKTYGSYVAVKNVTRQYGEENPRLNYSVIGDGINGKPELSCEADKSSPSGRYAIHITPGTVTGEDIEFVDGYLVVSRAPLKVIANDAQRAMGDQNPDFTFRCEGLKNDDTADDVFTEEDKMPQLTCEATPESPEGEYDIIISGPKSSKNYSLKYVAGKLTISGVSAIDACEDGPAIEAAGRTIVVKAAPARGINLYAADGTLVGHSDGTAATFHVKEAGIYIIRTAGGVYKVSL